MASLGWRFGAREFHQPSPAGSYAHTPSDGHYHGLRVRFEDGPLIHDYWKSWGPDYFCEEVLEMSVQDLLIGGAGQPPLSLSVRQVVDRDLEVVPSLRGGSGEPVRSAGLAARIAVDGLLSFDYGVPAHARGEVTVRVYDLRGRLVRTIPTEVSVPGWTRITWDRHDDSGNPVTGGVYVAVVQAGTEVVRTRLIVPAR